MQFKSLGGGTVLIEPDGLADGGRVNIDLLFFRFPNPAGVVGSLLVALFVGVVGLLRVVLRVVLLSVVCGPVKRGLILSNFSLQHKKDFSSASFTFSIFSRPSGIVRNLCTRSRLKVIRF